MHAAEVRVVYVATLTDAEVLQCWAQHSPCRAGWTVPGRPMFHHLNAEWGNRYDALVHPWKPEFKPFLTVSAEGRTPSHFETPSSLRSTSHFTAVWKSICRSLCWWRWRSKQWAFWMQWILEAWRKVAVGSVYEIFVYLRAWFIKGGFHMPFLFQIPSYRPGYILTIWENLSQLFFCKQRQLQRCGCSHRLRWPSVTDSVTARLCQNLLSISSSRLPAHGSGRGAVPGRCSGCRSAERRRRQQRELCDGEWPGHGTELRSSALLRAWGKPASPSPVEQRWAALGSLIYGGAILPAILTDQSDFFSSFSELGSAAQAAERLSGDGVCVEILTVGHESRWAMGSVGAENHRGVHGSWSASHVPGMRREVKGRGTASTSAGMRLECPSASLGSENTLVSLEMKFKINWLKIPSVFRMAFHAFLIALLKLPGIPLISAHTLLGFQIIFNWYLDFFITTCWRAITKI